MRSDFPLRLLTLPLFVSLHATALAQEAPLAPAGEPVAITAEQAEQEEAQEEPQEESPAALSPQQPFAQGDRESTALASTREAVVAASETMLSAIEEFRIQTATLSGETSTLVNATPAARPAWHGRLYHNFRNNALDAIPHQIVQRDGEQRKLRRNQYGLVVSGPVFIPKIYNGTGKTFFTFSYEGMRESIGQTDLNTIPTMLERTGSWAHVVDVAGNPLPIYDPKSTFANPGYNPELPVSRDNLLYNRLQYPGNIIPATDLDPVARDALQYYPDPNANAGPFFRNNYFVVSQEDNSADGFIFTVDHSFLDKNRVTVRINNSSGVNGSAPTFLTIANPANPPTVQSNRSLRVEHIYTASATNINTFAVEVSSNQFERESPLGSSGRAFPRYEIDGYQNMGNSGPYSRNANNQFQLTDTFSTRWRTHRFSIGTNLQNYQINTFEPRNPEGRFQFTPGLTSLPGIINTGHGFASYLLGEAAFAEKGIVSAPSYFRWGQYNMQFADQWQVRPSLTFTYDANFQIHTPRTEKFDRQSNIAWDVINPANGRYGALVAAGTNGYGRAFSPTFRKFQGRMGLAWSVLGDNDTVIRVNSGRFYQGYNRGAGHFGTQAFNGTPVWLSSNQQLEPAVTLRNGLRNVPVFPNLSLDAANGTVADYIDTSDRQPTQMFVSVELQRQLAPFLILTVSFNRQFGRNDRVGNNGANPNAIPLDALAFEDQLNDLAFANAQRPFPQYQDFNVNGFPAARHLQKTTQIRLEKRTSGGLAMSASYRYQRRYDNASQNVQNYYNLEDEWALSSFTNPHQFDFNYIYELPFGPGKQFLNGNSWMTKAFGGWAISGVGSIFSGNPITLRAQFNNTGGVVPNLRANVVPGVYPKVENPGPELWFNPAAFVQPENFQAGNTPRTHPTLRNPGGWNTDLTMNKRMPIGGDRTLELMASMFNALNHANWNNPDTRIGPADAPNANAGKIIGSTGGRIVQLGLRLNF